MQEKLMHRNIIVDWGLAHCNTKQRWLFELMLVSLGVLLISISAQITVPTMPVPTTLQDVTILFLAMITGSKRSTAMVMSYLIAGLAGAPVFAGLTAGPLALLTPSAGFLVGFLPLAYLSGFLAERGWGKSIPLAFLAGLIAVTMLFIAGVSYLAIAMGLSTAITVGVVPFVGISLIKLVAVSVIVPFFWK